MVFYKLNSFCCCCGVGIVRATIIIIILASYAKTQEDAAVTKFRNYLRIQAVQPNPTLGYQQTIEWLKEQARLLDLDFNLLDLGENDEFALWMTWKGSNPSLKSVLLNSHMDVVPAESEKWIHPPFEAFKDSNGNIFGRGTTDMKSATVATLQAIQRLKESGFQPVRTIHVLVMPEEEKGGFRGVKPFVKTKEFRNLNVGVDIDEGGVNPGNDTMAVWYAEKAVWQFNITAKGKAGHGSTLPEFTAGQRLQVVINKLLEFRAEQFKKLQNPGVSLDHLTVLNLVQLGGGLAENTIPNEMWATFDMRVRLTPQWNFTDVENMLLNIIEDAKLGAPEDPDSEVSIQYIAKTMETGETVTNSTSFWWNVLASTCKELNVTCLPTVANAATDGRYFRDMGIPVFGIGPFLNTPYTLHQDNEMMNESEFLLGISRYAIIIRNFASVSTISH